LKFAFDGMEDPLGPAKWDKWKAKRPWGPYDEEEEFILVPEDRIFLFAGSEGGMRPQTQPQDIWKFL
jgi:hypothetical protein